MKMKRKLVTTVGTVGLCSLLVLSRCNYQCHMSLAETAVYECTWSGQLVMRPAHSE